MKNKPAFPTLTCDENGGSYTDDSGASLRDYFAAKAMQGILANPKWDPHQQSDSKRLARSSFDYADAMLKARNEP